MDVHVWKTPNTSAARGGNTVPQVSEGTRATRDCNLHECVKEFSCLFDHAVVVQISWFVLWFFLVVLFVCLLFTCLVVFFFKCCSLRKQLKRTANQFSLLQIYTFTPERAAVMHSAQLLVCLHFQNTGFIKVLLAVLKPEQFQFPKFLSCFSR